jgi:hypothetical protein
VIKLLKIKAKIIEAGWTITGVVNELNYRNNTNYSIQNLSKKLVNGTIRYREAEEIADIIGYTINWDEKKQS